MLSLGASVWQVATRSGADDPADSSRLTRSSAQGHGSPATRPQLPAAADKRDHGVPPEIAKLDRAQLEQRLAVAEARLDKALPLAEKFDLSPPSPENEARMRPIFDRVFQTKPGEPPLYTLECHGPVCRLETDVSMNEWQEPLFAEEDAIFSSMQVGPTSYFRLEEPGRAAGLKYSVKVITAFLEAPATKECKERNPGNGAVGLALHLDAASHAVLVTSSGALASTAVGVCLRRTLEDLIARTPPPPEITAVVEDPFQVRVP